MGIFKKDATNAKNNDKDVTDFQNDTFKSCKEMNMFSKSFKSCKEDSFVNGSMMSSGLGSEDKEEMTILEPDHHHDGVPGEERGAWNNQVWADAATQIFYSLGPAFGGLITLSSYNKRDNNCQRDAILIALINSGTSIFARFVIFSILGFMAQELNVPVSEVVEGGIGLAFVVYPTAVTKLPVSPLWSFLFFTMLLTLGLDSQFTMVETLITALYDEKPSLRKHNCLVVGGVCLVGLLFGLPMCLQGGFYIFVLLDEYSGAWSLLVLAVVEVVLVGWVYGTERLCMDIYHMGIRTNRYLSYYWVLTWKISTPLLLSCVLVATLLDYQPAKEGDYVFPAWANGVGWGVAISSLLAVLPLCPGGLESSLVGPPLVQSGHPLQGPQGHRHQHGHHLQYRQLGGGCLWGGGKEM